MTVRIDITQLPHGRDLPLPAYATRQSAGMDLHAAVESDTIIAPGQRVLIPCGIAIALPDNYEAQIRPRSGLAFKQGLTVCNAPGTIDADYRGEIKALMINLGNEPVVVTRGMRVAQMVIAPVTQAEWRQVEALDETERSAGGFGSTGAQAKVAAK